MKHIIFSHILPYASPGGEWFAPISLYQRECPMEARLFINAGTHVVGVVDGTAEMTKCENGDITAATLRYAPTTRVRRKTAPIEPSTFQTFSPTFQLRIAIPPSTMCQTTTRNSDFWHVLCLFSFFFFVMFLFSFVCLFFFLLVFF